MFFNFFYIYSNFYSSLRLFHTTQNIVEVYIATAPLLELVVFFILNKVYSN